ncbi:hypothetical protein PTKIN_Ptkin07bG0264500 [Pterospermum kingtungense]
MEHTSRYMFLQVIDLGIGQEKTKLLQMSLVFAHQKCNLSMYYLDGKDLQLMVEY